MTKFFYLFLFCLVPMEALYSIRSKATRTCARPEIAHGTARLKQRGRMARYECLSGYQLVGDKYATCLGGRWDMPKPVCVRGGCPMPKIDHAIILPTHRNAWLNIFCLPGYTGSATLFCDGQKWNGTAPVCVSDPVPVELSCDFETPSLCGWTQDSRHDFDWTRINKKTPSSFLFTGPAFDHTFGESKQGYYMYIESSSRSENDTARLISPVYAGGLEKNGCFSFFYHMYGRSIGGLRVYQIPESQKDHVLDDSDTKEQYLLFEKWGNQGDEWFRNVSYLKDVSDNFQIVIEGIRGTSFTSDVAIDDVAILSGPQCEQAFASAITPAEDIPDSCAGRCSELSTPHRGCGCSTACISDSDCCADFLEVCVFNSDFANRYDDDPTTVKSISDAPRTEKLVAITLTTTTTSTTTTRPTTTTLKPTTPKPTTPKPKLTTRPTTKRPRPIPMTIPYGTQPVIPVKVTTKLTTKVVATTTVRGITAEVRRDVDGAKHASEAKKIVQDKQKGASAAAGVITLLVFCVLVVGAALAARSARGRAALARLRGRAASDPEVRYLTSDHD
ncbi:MAM and LDL-receptor class A domain-containing protein 2-like [Cydia pomonella]|uniref:MAM and LDL-receptor class A domain-containing protein 2-like n=1 Tax=Cydia pomonella TaxID=82600 RepID=UPI002ADE3B16|nr:MAM and LDL-receptor class A domain-containing protein 2-like [Cydia pomonella]